MKQALWIALALLLAPLSVAAENAATGELVNRQRLRVCANPSNFPFSDKNGNGFENKIAVLLAERLGRKLEYTWYPATIGFVRNTLRMRRCDLIIGITGLHELVQNTNPYYRTMWTMVQRTNDQRKIENINSPLLATMKIGIIAQTPPVTALAKRSLLDNIVSYHLRVDTREDNPSHNMLHDLATGKIDVAFAYGPIAGYWAQRLQTPLTVVPLDSINSGTRMDFTITMGIRRNEPQWKKTINQLLRDNLKDITVILEDYRVPLLPL